MGLSEEHPWEARPGTGTGEARIQGISQYPTFTIPIIVLLVAIGIYKYFFFSEGWFEYLHDAAADCPGGLRKGCLKKSSEIHE